MGEPLLEVAGLEAYYGKSHILHGVTFQVGEGEIVALLGRNGVGRSTTIKAIMGDVPPKGSIRFRGQEIAGLKPHQTALKGLGYVPETRDVFSALTVRQNLQLGEKPGKAGGRWAMADMFRMFPRLEERADTRAGVHLRDRRQFCRSADLRRSGASDHRPAICSLRDGRLPGGTHHRDRRRQHEHRRRYKDLLARFGGEEKTKEFARLFMVPGMDHCGFGTGPNRFDSAAFGGAQPPAADPKRDMFTALSHWVEDGVAPAQVIATKFVGGDASKGIEMQRPLCPYPQRAWYKGDGDTNAAANFACALDKK